MQDFPGNSAKARAQSDSAGEERPVERVVSGDVKRKKVGVGRRFKETFINGTARGAVEYMIIDVIVPEIQNTLIDAFQGGIERLIRGESRRRGSTPTGYSGVGHVNYQGMSTTKPPSAPTRLSSRARGRQSFDEIIIQSHQEASDVLDRMYEELSRFGSVPVSSLYRLTGIESSHTDTKWGWTSLRGARVARLRAGGYLLDLPEPETL